MNGNLYNSEDFGIVLWYTIMRSEAVEILGNHNPDYLRELTKQDKSKRAQRKQWAKRINTTRSV